MPLGEPQFATVSVLLADEVVGTFRVPINDETTVRRLAKDTMHRFLTCRGQRHHLHMREAISVTEVFVNSGAQKAEIFAQDIVTHVVLVKDEMLYLRLRLKETALVAETTISTTSDGVMAIATNGAVDKTSEEVMRNESDITAKEEVASIQARECADSIRVDVIDTDRKQEHKQDSNRIDKLEKKNENAENASDHMNSTSGRRIRTFAASKRKAEEKEEEEKDGKGVSDVPCDRKRRGTERGLGWGPEAHKHFPDNYISSPNKLMQKPRMSRMKTAAKKVSPQRRSTPPQSGPSSTTVAEDEVQQKYRPGWGPEATKYFPDNYVASPDRIARLNRQAKRQALKLQEEAKKKKRVTENEAVEQDSDLLPRTSGIVLPHEAEEPRTAPAAAPIANTTPETLQHGAQLPEGLPNSEKSSENTQGTSVSFPIMVERELSYENIDDVGAPSTPTSQSTGRLLDGLVELKSSHDQLPPGWGKEAGRYFDVETYFDNPNKAKLSPGVLSRPVRARREISLPYYFAALDQ